MKSPNPSYHAQTLEKLLARRAQPLSARLRDALAAADPALPKFHTGQELIDFQRPEDTDWRPKDAVLSVLVRSQRADPRDRESHELLLDAMLPVVQEIFRDRAHR